MALLASTVVGIAVYEDYRGEAYIPIAGDVPTIGFGETEGVEMGDTTNPVEALQKLTENIDEKYAQAVRDCIKVPLHYNEFDAYTSLAFNIGTKAFCDSTLVKKVNAFDYIGGCLEIERWVYANGKKINGLVKRRALERARCEGKDNDNS